jgi:hypothetical protein
MRKDIRHSKIRNLRKDCISFVYYNLSQKTAVIYVNSINVLVSITATEFVLCGYESNICALFRLILCFEGLRSKQMFHIHIMIILAVRFTDYNISEQLRLDTTYYNLVIRYLISKVTRLRVSAFLLGHLQANINNKITKYRSVLHGIPWREETLNGNSRYIDTCKSEEYIVRLTEEKFYEQQRRLT